VKEFLTEEARRRFLDKVQRRLRTEGSPVVIEREAGIPAWVAYLLADQASASDNREVLKLADLGELPVPSECSLQGGGTVGPGFGAWGDVRKSSALPGG
jgi:hypothetical protein